jgi:hypothetical protein
MSLNDSAAIAPAGSQPEEKAAAEARPAPKLFAAPLLRLASKELLREGKGVCVCVCVCVCV